ncbi:YtxH domain-containing protein [Ulvibacterium marinum]|uniref:YtxH domain-containing protein n=1 Tax=Ulvibacterium marinum TaxID=2419782 RepID=A0A3B0C1U2_9FLAO|nr:YtxH domain-containing protein [Ulvibacterium marinum]RKN78708.1 YtxH domain-containing protein [Ulvibacterium marinum]
MSNEGNTVLGILAGTAIGAALGILFAPDKGTNTRRKIADQAAATQESLRESALDMKDKVSHSLANGKESLETRVESLVSDASYKTEDVISSLENQLKVLKAKNRQLQKS